MSVLPSVDPRVTHHCTIPFQNGQCDVLDDARLASVSHISPGSIARGGRFVADTFRPLPGTKRENKVGFILTIDKQELENLFRKCWSN